MDLFLGANSNCATKIRHLLKIDLGPSILLNTLEMYQIIFRTVETNLKYEILFMVVMIRRMSCRMQKNSCKLKITFRGWKQLLQAKKTIFRIKVSIIPGLCYNSTMRMGLKWKVSWSLVDIVYRIKNRSLFPWLFEVCLWRVRRSSHEAEYFFSSRPKEEKKYKKTCTCDYAGGILARGLIAPFWEAGTSWAERSQTSAARRRWRWHVHRSVNIQAMLQLDPVFLQPCEAFYP